MNKEEIQEILEELHLVRPEILQPKAKKLFEIIMIIADESDELQQRIDKAIEYCNKTKEPYEKYYGKSFDEYDWVVDIARDLLEILKGSNQ